MDENQNAYFMQGKASESKTKPINSTITAEVSPSEIPFGSWNCKIPNIYYHKM
jgi:hypothetical protein